jgi:hypothetical protein
VLSRHGIVQCVASGDYYRSADLVSISGQRIHPRYAVALDVPHQGDAWAFSGETVVTTDGRTIHTASAIQVSWRDGKDYIMHKDDDLNEELPNGDESAKFEAIPLPVNAGRPWREDEDRALLARFDAGYSLADMVAEHRRTTGAIRARLVRYGRLNAQ